jgi:glucokinase
MAKKLAIGVDLGASRVRVCVGNREGKFLKRVTRDMEIRRTVEDYLLGITAGVKEVLRAAPRGEIEGIGVASIGPLDISRGGIAKPANLPYRFIPILESLEDAFGLETTLVNDANAAALGEKTYGAGTNDANLVYVTVSTGIGGGAIVDGRLLLGKDGNAAEIGHMVIDPEGKLRCGCGKRGHWEAYCSGRNIPHFSRLLITRMSESQKHVFRGSKLVKEPPSSTRLVFEEASRGDEFARFVVGEIGRLNSMGIANCTNLFDPSLITLGGGVAINNPGWILDPIKKLVSRHAFNKVPKIIITPLGDDAGLLGALSVAFEPGLVDR